MRKLENILVTGGLGFIGSAFIRALLARPDFAGRITNLDALTYAANPEGVAGVDESRYRFVRGDVCDAALLESVWREHGIDTIVHFAAESHLDRSIHDPGVFIQTNVLGTFQLLELVRRHPTVHLHHVSTDEVFGTLDAPGRFTEHSPYRPSSPYAASKAASDHLVRAYGRTFGIAYTLSNSSNNYGPFQFPEKLIPLMICHLLERRPLPIYGDGRNVRDWVHVEDHVEAVWTILRSAPAGESYGIGGESERSNLEIVQRIVELFADLTRADAAELRGLVTFVADRPGHDLRYAIDCSKLVRDLGWSRRHTLDTGLRDTVQWYLDHPAWLDRVRSGGYREWLDRNYGARG